MLVPGVASTYPRERERYRLGDPVWIRGVRDPGVVYGDTGERVIVQTDLALKSCDPNDVSADGPVLEVVSS